MLPNYIGRRFGRLFVESKSETRVRKNIAYNVLCDCGVRKLVTAAQLKDGLQSCGCRQVEAATATLARLHKTQGSHGMSGTPTYRSWDAMMARCFDYKCERFARYGAKGITACEYLRSNPQHLIALIGERPDLKFSLDRIENSGNYSCGSCHQCKKEGWTMNLQWATSSEQANNRRNNVWISINGETKTRAQWAAKMGISYKKAMSLLKKYEKMTTIQPPKGYQLPEGTVAGVEFQELVTFKVGKDGLTITQIGDIPMEADKKTESKPDYSQMAQSIAGGVGGGDGDGAGQPS